MTKLVGSVEDGWASIEKWITDAERPPIQRTVLIMSKRDMEQSLSLPITTSMDVEWKDIVKHLKAKIVPWSLTYIAEYVIITDDVYYTVHKSREGEFDERHYGYIDELCDYLRTGEKLTLPHLRTTEDETSK